MTLSYADQRFARGVSRLASRFVSRSAAGIFLVALVVLLSAHAARAASCCGGGSGATLVLPKYARHIVDVSADIEQYGGFWNKDGDYLEDPAGSDLWQYRLNVGTAVRLAPRWQAGVSVPYVWNDNTYSGTAAQSHGVGDMGVNVWYETFDGITCVSRVRSLRELRPAAYLGATLTIPTGISPYDDQVSSLEITGRGFYRLDVNALVEKTVYPFNASLMLSVGTHLERPVNMEYGKYVEPYHKTLGNRALGSFSFGYSHLLASLHSLTLSLAYSHLWEGEGTLNDTRDPTTGFEKKSLTGTIALASMNGTWVFRSGWNHGIKQDGWGKNFPATDTYNMGVSRVFH